MEPEKLGTEITYLDLEETGTPVEVCGVKLMPDQTVDLKDFMSEDRAKEVAAIYAQNHFFRVQGGPDHGGAADEYLDSIAEHNAKVEATIAKQVAAKNPGGGEPLPPETYEAPTEMKLAGAQKSKGK